MLIGRAAADSHAHPSYFRVPQLLAHLAPPGQVFAASQAPIGPAHWEDQCEAYVAVGESPGLVAMGQATEVVALGNARTSPGLALVAHLATRPPWYLHRQP
jgi:hypothetical protein